MGERKLKGNVDSNEGQVLKALLPLTVIQMRSMMSLYAVFVCLSVCVRARAMLTSTVSLQPLVEETWLPASVHGPGLLASTHAYMCV